MSGRGAGSAPTIHDVASAAGSVEVGGLARPIGCSGGGGATVERVRRAAAAWANVANAHARGCPPTGATPWVVFVRDAATPFYGHLLTAFQEQPQRAVSGGHGDRAGSFSVEDERRALETLVTLSRGGGDRLQRRSSRRRHHAFARRIPVVVAGPPRGGPHRQQRLLRRSGRGPCAGRSRGRPRAPPRRRDDLHPGFRRSPSRGARSPWRSAFASGASTSSPSAG